MTWLADVETKLARLAQLDDNYKVFGAKRHRYQRRTPCPVDTVERFESDHEVTLPEALKHFYTGLSDGGPGPGYGLLPFERLTEMFAGDAVALNDLGCGLYNELRLRGPDAGSVWKQDANDDDSALVANSFADWYRAWLDGALAPFVQFADRLTAMEAATPTATEWMDVFWNHAEYVSSVTARRLIDRLAACSWQDLDERRLRFLMGNVAAHAPVQLPAFADKLWAETQLSRDDGSRFTAQVFDMLGDWHRAAGRAADAAACFAVAYPSLSDGERYRNEDKLALVVEHLADQLCDSTSEAHRRFRSGDNVSFLCGQHMIAAGHHQAALSYLEPLAGRWDPGGPLDMHRARAHHATGNTDNALAILDAGIAALKAQEPDDMYDVEDEIEEFKKLREELANTG